MEAKVKFLLFLFVMTILVACASFQYSKQEQEFREYLASMINIMTYDQAVKSWGEPSSKTNEDEVFIAVWEKIE